MKELQYLYDRLFGEPWKMWQGAIIVAVLTIGLFIIYAPWTTVGFVILGQHLYHTLGLPLEESAPDDIDFLHNEFGMLWVMMLIGALGSSLLGKEFAVRVPPPGEMVKGVMGGILMGMGFIIGVGCTAGGFFNGWAVLSGGALVFGIGLMIGNVIAVRYLVWELNSCPRMSSGRSHTYLRAERQGTSLQPLAGLVVIAVGAALALLYDPGKEKSLMGFVLIGLIIGVALQRSGFCITRAMREPFLTSDSEATEAIIAGMLVALFGFTVIKGMANGELDMVFVELNFWVPGLLGGLIFGVGMGVVGGCTVGSLRGAGDGFVKFWFAIIGMVLAAPLTAEYINPRLLDMLPDWMKQRVFLPDNFGYPASVVIVIVILFMWWLLVKWNERTQKLSAF